MLCILHKDNALLPSHDSLAIPAYAHLFTIAGGVPENLVPLSTEEFYYPPGFVVIFSIVSILFGNYFTLALFKYSCIFSVAIAPFVWGSFLKKQFKGQFQSISNLAFYGLIYVAFFYMERTQLFALSCAGKNAQLMVTALLPVVLLIIFNEVSSIKSAFTTSFILAGVYLCHYSFVYMLFGSSVAYLCVNFTSHKSNLKYIIASLFMSVLLFIPWVLRLSFGGLGDGNYAGVLATLNTFAHYFIDSNSSYLTIFNFFKFESYANKNKLIIFSVVISSMYSFFLFYKERKEVYKPVLFVILCIIGFGLLGAGFFPGSKINADYVRWFSYSFSALIMFIGTYSLVCIMKLLLNRFLSARTTAFITLASICGCLYLTMQVSPKRLMKNLYKRNQDYKTTWKKLRQWSDFLALDGVEYNFITQSKPLLPNVDSYYMLPNTYVDNFFVISNARVINGSWYTASWPGSRDIENLPGDSFYEAYFKDLKALPLYYLATEQQAKLYENKVSIVRLIPKDRDLDNFKLFKIEPKS